MADENVDLVRRIYEEGMLDQDPERLLGFVAPEIEYVNPPEAVESGVRRGIAEVGQALRNMSQGFDSSRNELQQLFGDGDTVVAAVSFCTRSRGSEAEVVQEEAHTWTLRDGKIVRFQWGRDLPAALEAAGISE